MDETKREKLLAISYPLLIACGFICCVTSATAWNHWKYVLDTCVNEINCGCILNGISTITYFTGGHVAYCHVATFALLFPMLAAFILGSYHVWRVCMSSNHSRTHTMRQRYYCEMRAQLLGQKKNPFSYRSGDIIVMTSRAEVSDNGISPNYWVPAAIISIVMFIFTLIYASLYLNGFLQSCRQYRNELIKYMRATGPMVAAVQGRISCPAVFDFMDYLHPDVSFDRRRLDRINTPMCLVLSLIGAWVSVGLWLVVSIINVVQARGTRKLRM